MKKLSVICVLAFFLGFLSSSVFAIQYCKDFLEVGNPGGWGTSPKTFDDTWLLCFVDEEIELDVWINDAPEPLVQAGFWMTYDPSFVSVVDVDVYDGTDLPGPWDPATKITIVDPDSGTCFAAVASLTSVPPDADGDIIIAKVRFRSESMPGSEITVFPIPEFDTIVGESSTVFDPGIIPNTIILVVGSPPCGSPELNPPSVDLSPNSSQQFSVISGCSPCYTPYWQWSDDCTQGDIDQSGLFTAGVITIEENCTTCVADQANTGLQDCSEITLQIGECEGNFDDDQDVDGSDAAKFVIDFGRSIFLNPCTNNNLCNGDFDCDVDVDGTDAAKFKEDFGRGQHENPCPCCPRDPWCTYP